MSITSAAPSPYVSPALPRRSALGVDRRSATSVRSRYRRQTAALMIGTTVVGLWFGFNAPTVSPVTPPATVGVTGTADDPTAGLTPGTSGDRGRGPGPRGRDGRQERRP